MDLGLARASGSSEATTRPARAELVDHAHDEAKRAIAELRELVRGIHPAVLTDRGLDAALSALAARCPVPGRAARSTLAERAAAPRWKRPPTSSSPRR